MTDNTKEATIRAGYLRNNTFENLGKCLEKLQQGSSYCYRA